MGPYWPWYKLNAVEIENSAYIITAGRLQNILAETALEVAKHAAILMNL